MADLDKWLRLYESSNPDVRIRAANALLHRGNEIPLWILLSILDEFPHSGLGADAEKVLLKRDDPELFDEMVKRLNSEDWFIREVACNVLGKLGNLAATPHLLGKLDDPHIMVRRGAGFALAFLKDSNTIPELKRQYEKRRDDDINVRLALERALRSLGATFKEHPW